MTKIKITAIRKVQYDDLMAKYENPIEHTCDVCEGQSWISENGKCPKGLCPEAWKTMKEFIEALARGEGNFYDGWMKNPYSAMISCNDGFRPVSFFMEVLDNKERVYPLKEDYIKAIGSPIASLHHLKRFRPFINVDGTLEYWYDDNFIVFKMLDSLSDNYIIGVKCPLKNIELHIDAENERLYENEIKVKCDGVSYPVIVTKNYFRKQSFTIDSAMDSESNAFELSDNGKKLIYWKRASGEFGKSLDPVVIPEGVVEISEFAFAGCENIREVIIPRTVKSICKYAFAGCGSFLLSFESNSIDFIGENAFWGCTIKTNGSYPYYFPDTIRKCHEKALHNTLFLIKGKYKRFVHFWNNGKWEYRFEETESNNIAYSNKIYNLVKELSANCSTTNDGLVYDSSHEYILRCDNREIEDLVIPSTIIGICHFAFYNCDKLKHITFNKGLKFLGDESFCGCICLKEINLPHSIEYIGSGAFENCGNLKCAEIKGDICSINGGTFKGCSSLETINIPKSVESIGAQAFAYCSNLKEIQLPDNLISIGQLAFYKTGITDFTIPNNLVLMGASPFSFNNKLKIHGNNELFCMQGPFLLGYHCQRLISYHGNENNIVIPTSVNALLDSCLCNNNKQSRFYLPNSITHIGSHAFNFASGYCVNIPDSIMYIAKNLGNYNNITNVYASSKLIEFLAKEVDHMDVYELLRRENIKSIASIVKIEQ